MKISDLLLTYVFVKGIDKLREKEKEKEKENEFEDLPLIVQAILAIFSIICLILTLSVVIDVLFF